MPYVGSTVSLLTLTLALAQAADEIQSKTFISVLDMANVQFVDGLILESQARSTLDCLRMCSTQTCCNRFTFAASRTTRGVCRCHRNAVSGTFALGSRTFIVSRNVRSGTPTNVALCKTAIQSSTFYDNDAGWAVDGNSDPVLLHRSCAHTGLTATRSWWQVDLGAYYHITSVIIINRHDDCGDACERRLRDFDILVYSTNPWNNSAASSTLCYHYNGAAGATEELQCCNAPITGRFVRISNTPNEYLTLCEVKVMAIPYSEKQP